MKRCLVCVMPDTRPDVPFIDGVCAACRNHSRRSEIDWDARWKELIQLLDVHYGRVIVPSSGGKDSSYIALTLKSLGAEVTAITATTCYLTPLGRANLNNLARHVRAIEVTPNMSIRAKLNRMGLETVGDASWAQHASIWAVPFKMAGALKIPLIMWGENSQDAYGGPIGSEHAKQMTRRWCSEYGGLNGLRASDFVGKDGITWRDMLDYQFPNDSDLSAAGIEGHFLGAYQAWDSQRNADIAKLHGLHTQLPCDANWWDFENLDCFMTAWHDVGMYRKFGFGRGCAQISVDVRHGRVSREAALAWVLEHDGLFPETYAGVTTEQGLHRLGMTRSELISAFDKFTNWALFDGIKDHRPLLKEFCE